MNVHAGVFLFGFFKEEIVAPFLRFVSFLTVYFTVNGLHFQDLPTSLQPKGRQVNNSLPPASPLNGVHCMFLLTSRNMCPTIFLAFLFTLFFPNLDHFYTSQIKSPLRSLFLISDSSRQPGTRYLKKKKKVT